jgi:hypothetical protein
MCFGTLRLSFSGHRAGIVCEKGKGADGRYVGGCASTDATMNAVNRQSHVVYL